jgi:hypothetical protein
MSLANDIPFKYVTKVFLVKKYFIQINMKRIRHKLPQLIKLSPTKYKPLYYIQFNIFEMADV